MSIETLLIVALAVYRLSLLISKEAGPFDMFGRLRTLAGVRFDQYSNPYATNQFSEGLLCPFCVSVWLGICATLLLVAAQLFHFEQTVIYLMLPFALSGMAVFIFKWTGV